MFAHVGEDIRMAKTILELAAERVVVFDGAMGTMLLASGLHRRNP